MFGLSRVGLKYKLIAAFCFVIIFTCGGTGIFSYYTSFSVMNSNIQESLEKMANEGGKYILAVMDTKLTEMKSVANRYTIQSMDWEKQLPVLQEETKRLNYLAMAVVTPDGTAHYQNNKTAELGDRAYVKAAFSGKTVFSNVIFSRVIQKPVIMLATPIYSAGNTIAAVLIARIDGNMLSEIVSTIKYGEHGYSFIIDNNGCIVAHINQDYVNEAKNFIEEAKQDQQYKPVAEMLQEMKQGKIGFAEYYLDGQERLFGYSPVPDSQWSVAIGALKNEVYAGIYSMRTAFIIIGGAFFVLGAIYAFISASMIVTPILNGVNLLINIAEQGDLRNNVEDKFLRKNDEIGLLAKAVNNLIISQREQAGILEKISEGDLKVEVSARSEHDSFSQALAKMIQQMSTTLRSVSIAAQQVSSGSEQISNASQSLSQGATESAASIEQVTSSITEIGGQSKQNAENAHQAKQLAGTAQHAADNGNNQMQEMISAITDINASSQQISQIIRVIDDIAFQTNLLALNAAVEAARAGVHGKGFAVVAEEVRNLAARSAKAANETTALIESSALKVAKGTSIAEETASALNEIVSVVEKVASLVNEIASASSEQAQGVSQVIQGMGQIESVTMQNTANAEQTASAAVQLVTQAQTLHHLVSKFHLEDTSSKRMKARKMLEGDSKRITKKSHLLERPEKQ